MNSDKTTLIIGASSAIAQATIKELHNQGKKIVVVSRSPIAGIKEKNSNQSDFVSDYSEESIGEITSQLLKDGHAIDQVFIFNGLLHNNKVMPEKRLEQLNESQLLDSFRVNTIIPALWLKHLKKLLRRQEQVLITVLNARVGSISDNRKGGWYSYRASKAALNMLLKSAAVEYEREAKNVSFLVYHPGTTDTPLSKPFQRNVPADQLFSPGFSAERLLEVVANYDNKERIQYRDWRNDPISW